MINCAQAETSVGTETAVEAKSPIEKSKKKRRFGRKKKEKSEKKDKVYKIRFWKNKKKRSADTSSDIANEKETVKDVKPIEEKGPSTSGKETSVLLSLSEGKDVAEKEIGEVEEVMIGEDPAKDELVGEKILDEKPIVEESGQENVEIVEKVVPSKQEILKTTHNMILDGDIKYRTGKYFGARAEYEKAFELCKTIVDDTNVDLALVKSRIARTCYKIGIENGTQDDIELAKKYYEESYSVVSEHLGSSHPEVVLIRDEKIRINSPPVEDIAVAVPKVSVTFFKRASKIRLEGDNSEAILILEQGLSILMEDVSKNKHQIYNILKLLGDVHFEQGLESYSKSVGSYKGALVVSKLLDEYKTENDYFILGNMGQIFLSTGNYESAKQVYQEAIAVYKNMNDELDGDLYYGSLVNNLGNVHCKLCEFNSAKAQYTESIKIKKAAYGESSIQVIGAVTNLGMVCLENEETKEAMHCFEEARTILSDTLASLTTTLQVNRNEDKIGASCNNLGKAYQKIGMTDAAVKCFEFVLTNPMIFSGPDEVYSAALMMGYIRSSEGKYDIAMDLYNKAMQNASSNSERATVWISMANVLVKRGDFLEAKAIYDQALTYFSRVNAYKSMANVLQNKGNVCRKTKDYENALACFDEAMKAREKLGDSAIPLLNGMLLTDMGKVYMAKGDYDEARAKFFKAENCLDPVEDSKLLKSIKKLDAKATSMAAVSY